MIANKVKVAVGAAALVASGTLALFSPQLQAFLGKWEGEGQNVVYADKLAGGLPTVCKGITKYASPEPVVVGDYWSEEQCEKIERMVVERGQISLADCIEVDVSQNTFDSLSSHSHNFGVPSTCASRAVGLINRGRLIEGCDALAHKPDGTPAWSYVGRAYVRGLYNRRLDERAWCMRPDR